jgi:hypothetical protein
MPKKKKVYKIGDRIPVTNKAITKAYGPQLEHSKHARLAVIDAMAVVHKRIEKEESQLIEALREIYPDLDDYHFAYDYDEKELVIIETL